MASQGEREPGVVGMCSYLEPMVQDKSPEQDTPVQDINVQEQFPPQLNPELEMGAAAAAEYDTSPSLLRNPPPLRQNPPIPVEQSAPDMAQLFAMLAGMNNKMDAMNAHTRALREEMQQMGRGLQAGMKAIACSETRTTECIMATPRAETNELGGECNGCRARGGGG